MRQVEHKPEMPKSGEPVTITIKATDPAGIQSVVLKYQVVESGQYINLTDAAYAANWTTVSMYDDGTHGDALAGDDIYTAVLPASLQIHRRLIRYKMTATNSNGQARNAPYGDDPCPNFAYFVYDGVPAWTGAVRPGVDAPVTYGIDVDAVAAGVSSDQQKGRHRKFHLAVQISRRGVSVVGDAGL